MFAFTIYTAPASIGKYLKTGDRVVVNKLSHCQDLQRGNLIVFTVSGEPPAFALVGPPQQLGQIIAVPGDVIVVKKQRYRIPYKCCDRCQCVDCKLYLVDTGHSQRLVHKHQIVGKAYEFIK